MRLVRRDWKQASDAGGARRTKDAIADVLTGTGKRSYPDRAPLLIATGVIDDSHTGSLSPHHRLPWDFEYLFPILENDLKFEYSVSCLQIVNIK